MAYDLKLMNKVCDHILRGVPYFVSEIDCRTLLPRKDPSIYVFSDPVISGVSEIKKYDQFTRIWDRIAEDDPQYGWEFKEFPIILDQPSLGSTLQIRFKERQNNLQQIWKVSYQVAAKNCTKCASARVVSDLTLLNDPDTALIVKYEAKLAQDFLKFLLTPRGSDPYHPWVGTDIPDLPGSKFDFRDLEMFITTQVSATAEAIKNLQAQQVRISSQQVHPREMLDSVSLIRVQQSSTDPRVIIIKIELMTQSRTLTNLSFPLRRG